MLIKLLTIFQVLISILLIGSILLQQRGNGLSSAFGGQGTYYARRGAEKILFRTTITLSVLFIASAILHFILS